MGEADAEVRSNDRSVNEAGTSSERISWGDAVPSGRARVTGRLRCHRLQAIRRGGRDVLARLIRDLVDPLPVHELWVIEDVERKDYAGRPVFYRSRSGRVPKALAGIPEGRPFEVTMTVDPWENGLGGYVSRCHLNALLPSATTPTPPLSVQDGGANDG